MPKRSKHFADARCFFHTQKGVVILRAKKAKLCFSKKLLIADYVVLAVLLVWLVVLSNQEKDTTNMAVVIAAWIAQIAVSSGFYYWKAKSENLVKMPIQMLKDLPEDMKEKADPNQIIASVLGLKD